MIKYTLTNEVQMFDKVLEGAIHTIPVVMPKYHPDAADINEAIDNGIASCAARSYMGALLVRRALPNENLYFIDFGFDPEHGSDYVGKEGTYLKMGHAVTRFYVPEKPTLIIESYDDGSMEIKKQNSDYDSFIWSADPYEGYCNYLEKACLEVEVINDDILRCFNKQLVLKNR